MKPKLCKRKPSLLVDEIRSTEFELQRAYDKLSYCVNEDLIDANIYYITALEKRYQGLLEEARSQSMTVIRMPS